MLKLEQIKQEVEALTGFESIETKRRKRKLVLARFIYMDLAYWYTNYSLEAIGMLIDRDHATVIHGLTNIDNYLKYEPEFKLIHKNLESEYKDKYGKKLKNITKIMDNDFRIKSRIIRVIGKMSRAQLEQAEKEIANIADF